MCRCPDLGSVMMLVRPDLGDARMADFIEHTTSGPQKGRVLS